MSRIGFKEPDIFPRKISLQEDIDAAEIKHFGKKVRITQIPIEMKKMLKNDAVEDDVDKAQMKALIVKLFSNQQQILNLTKNELNIVYNGMKESSTPRDYDYKTVFSDITKNWYLDKGELKDNISRVAQFSIRTHEITNRLKNTEGALSAEKPIWRYRNLDGRYTPTGIASIINMKNNMTFDLRYKAIIPYNKDIDDQGTTIDVESEKEEESESEEEEKKE